MRRPWIGGGGASAGTLRLCLAGALALTTLGGTRPRPLAVLLAAIPAAFDLLCHHRGSPAAFARSATAWIAATQVLLYFVSAARGPGPPQAQGGIGHILALLAAQFTHRGPLDLTGNTIAFLLLGSRVESLIGRRAFLFLTLLAAFLAAFSAMPAAHPDRICGAAALTICAGAAWPTLLAIRPGGGGPRGLSGSFQTVVAVHGAFVVMLLCMHGLGASPGTLLFSVMCGVLFPLGHQRWREIRTARLLRDFRMRKRARLQRHQQATTSR